MASRETSTQTEENVIELKITLKGTTPEIWRRLHISDNSTFAQLHKYLQDSIGWEKNSTRPYRFEINSVRIVGEEGYKIMSKTWKTLFKEEDVLVKEYFNKVGDTVLYVLDFEESYWEHEILLERIVPYSPAFPQCVGGEGGCPPPHCKTLLDFKRYLQELKEVHAPIESRMLQG